ncbi:MAG: flavin reductase [Clostridia bacterium]|nr:flavin reductase [Clostridia bacterium]
MDETVLYDISYGLYLIGAAYENTPTGCIANTVFQVSAFPPKVAVSLNHDNFTSACIKNMMEFSVSIVTENIAPDIISKFGFFSGKNTYKFENIEYKKIMNSLPVLTQNISGWLHCKVENIVDIGTHAIFIAEVIDSERLSNEPPMTYAYYHKNVKGKAPKNAPTYREEPKNLSENIEYVCEVCGYVYKGGDFESLPDDWVCPVCKVPKSRFSPKT